MKRRLPLTLTFIAGMIPIVAFFLNYQVAKKASDGLEQWMIIIAGFALLLGVVNVVQTNVKKIQKGESGWFYSLVLLISLFVMGAFGFLGGFNIFGGIEKTPSGSVTPFLWISNAMFIPLQATMFSILAFYIASAAFRAFRARSFEASILLISAVIVMLGRIPFGDIFLTWIPGGETFFSKLTEWIMDKPNAAAQRGIIIGAALGAASMSLKVILGIERTYLGSDS